MTAIWWTALAGGMLIGLSATLLLWLNGRIAGVSGILNGVMFPKSDDVSWRAAFLVGLIVAARRCRVRIFRAPAWSSPGCWSGSARAWAMAAPVAMASADLAACRCVRWRPC